MGEMVRPDDLRRASLLLVEAVSHLGMAISDMQQLLSEMKSQAGEPGPDRAITARVIDVGDVHLHLAEAWERLGDANTALGANDAGS